MNKKYLIGTICFIVVVIIISSLEGDSHPHIESLDNRAIQKNIPVSVSSVFGVRDNRFGITNQPSDHSWGTYINHEIDYQPSVLG